MATLTKTSISLFAYSAPSFHMTYLVIPAACSRSLSHYLLSLPIPLVPHCILSPLCQASGFPAAQISEATVDLELLVLAGPRMLPEPPQDPSFLTVWVLESETGRWGKMGPVLSLSLLAVTFSL